MSELREHLERIAAGTDAEGVGGFWTEQMVYEEVQLAIVAADDLRRQLAAEVELSARVWEVMFPGTPYPGVAGWVKMLEWLRSREEGTIARQLTEAREEILKCHALAVQPPPGAGVMEVAMCDCKWCKDA